MVPFRPAPLWRAGGIPGDTPARLCEARLNAKQYP
jgi:hypothetical protein